MEVHRGEVFYADLSPVVGSEQGGVRPVLIVQNEIGNRHSPTVIAAAITSRLDKTRLPTHINIRAADTGLAKDSVVLLEQIRTLDKHRLRQRAGQITPEDQKRVNQALDVSLGLDSYKCPRRALRGCFASQGHSDPRRSAGWPGGGRHGCRPGRSGRCRSPRSPP